MIDRWFTAKDAGVVRCLECHKLAFIQGDDELQKRCSRCGAKLHARKPNSIMRTWAFLLTSFIMLFPAYLLPIMTVTSFGHSYPSTIIEGIEHFIQEGTYFIGFLIFFASILVPIFKLIGITLILLSIQRDWKTSLKQKAVMLRIIRFIGRWSMLDIFVIAIMVALVNLGSLTTIKAAPAATFFAMVVVLTMLAATSFDTRHLWENKS